MARPKVGKATKRTARSRVARTPIQGPAAELRYMESSALLAALLEGDTAVVKTLRAGRYVTSALTFAEAGRAIIRARVSGRLTASQERAAVRALRTFERRCFVVDVSRDVLGRVSRPFPVEPIRTLDAAHIATAELLQETPQLLTVVTRDVRVRDNARALGYAVE